MIDVDIADSQSVLPVDQQRLRHAVQTVLAGQGVRSAEISIAIVDDNTIWELNQKYLQHDEPTDVLSFVLENSADHLIGEIVVSADTAVEVASQYDWTPADELLLYVVHGALHLTGSDDSTQQQRSDMRNDERRYLEKLGISAAMAAALTREPGSMPTPQRGDCLS